MRITLTFCVVLLIRFGLLSSYVTICPVISGIVSHLSDVQLIQTDTIPLTELGIQKWKDYEGGLYPNGKNVRPTAHDIAGLAAGKAIQPLNGSGNPDPNSGKIVLLSIGMSNTTQEFSTFKAIADTFKLKNPKLVIVDGAQGGQTALIIKDPLANFWTIVQQRLQQQNVLANQVQAVWLKEADASPKLAFPVHAQQLKDELKAIVMVMKKKYPNLKIVYLSSRIYGGYATTQLNPEPYAYESGFSVKWLIEEQINGDTSLIFSGNNPKAPWLAWGPYLWAKGIAPRADGLIWRPEDFQTDGTHPSSTGRLKVANLLLKFLSTDETAKSWFLKPQGTTGIYKLLDQDQENNSSYIYPNPFSDRIFLQNISSEAFFKLSDSLGQEIWNGKDIDHQNFSFLNNGFYFLEVYTHNHVKSILLLKH